jgi:serine/threonine-protein kinase SRPK3
VLVSVPNIDAVIEKTLRDDPSATYPPHIEPLLSPEPILTVKSQPLVFTRETLDHQNIEIRIADLGEGDIIGCCPPSFIATDGKLSMGFT